MTKIPIEVTERGRGCPKCEVCQNSMHHWLPDPAENSSQHWDHKCKHCNAVGAMCQECWGEGCLECEGEGVFYMSGESREDSYNDDRPHD